MNFSQLLKSIRMEKGFSQKEIAEKLGVSQPSYAQYENGKRNPKAETIKKIADALGVSIEEINPDLGNLSMEIVKKEIARQMKEIIDSTDLSVTEKQQKITELENIHLSIGERLHLNEEKQLKELGNTFVSLNQNGKELMLSFGNMLFKDEKYRDEMIHPSKIKDIPQD